SSCAKTPRALSCGTSNAPTASARSASVPTHPRKCSEPPRECRDEEVIAGLGHARLVAALELNDRRDSTGDMVINPEEHARLLRERREREAKMERENAERAQRYKQLETDLGIKIKPWCCPCKLRYPERHTGADHRDIRCVVSPVFDH